MRTSPRIFITCDGCGEDTLQVDKENIDHALAEAGWVQVDGEDFCSQCADEAVQAPQERQP